MKQKRRTRASFSDNISTNVYVGPQMNVDHVEAVNTKNNYICLQINKKNSIFLTISATFSFVLGSFLDKICCCATSASQKSTLILFALLVVGATIGGVIGNSFIKEKYLDFLFHC